MLKVDDKLDYSLASMDRARRAGLGTGDLRISSDYGRKDGVFCI